MLSADYTTATSITKSFQNFQKILNHCEFMNCLLGKISTNVGEMSHLDNEFVWKGTVSLSANPIQREFSKSQK